MPTLNKTFQAPGGIGRTCRGQDDGGQPRPILQVAFVESPCRTAVTDNDLDRRGIGNALDMCRHNVANARVTRALNVAALNHIPQGYADAQQQTDGAAGAQPADDDVVDADYEVVDDEDK